MASLSDASSTGELGKAGKEPTILDVAALAGLSKSTVSNVIRGSDGVAAATRERVERAIDALGYRPNALARQFVQQRTTILGVLIGDLENPFYADLAKRVERYAFDAGYTVMLCNLEVDPDYAASRVEALIEHRVAGVAFLAFFGRSLDIQSALRSSVPVVFAGVREDWGDSVSVDDGAGARLATEHLIGLGHRRIAYLTTPHVEPRVSRARAVGYRDAMRAAGLAAMTAIQWTPGDDDARVGRRTEPLLGSPDGRRRSDSGLLLERPGRDRAPRVRRPPRRGGPGRASR